ncbi:MAG TPA: hypothetical protein VFW65_32570 [Pseudonocardiaceae bacterium]|nr:hypothetical protein [Pseudonocardiaceae bacterium]
MTDISNRISWVLQKDTLAERLDKAWSGQTWRNDDADGLAAHLDTLPAWSGWQSWDVGKQLDELDRLLGEWEQPEQPRQEVQQVEDTSKPRWNATSGYWELYNADRQEWWAHDADSNSWFDPAAQTWVPREAGVHDDEPVSGSFGWVTDEQAAAFRDLYGADWAGPAAGTLTEKWGAGWQQHPAEHKRAWLTDLLPTLVTVPEIEADWELPSFEVQEAGSMELAEGLGQIDGEDMDDSTD